MYSDIDKIIMFKLSGKYAHFRKFYTNSSSLSYLIPPRTVIAGMLASILKIPRDEYYEIFDSEKIKISVIIPEGLVIRKQTQTLNYLHNEYYKLLVKGKGKLQPSQCKLELLMHPPGKNIEYIIALAGDAANEPLNTLEEKLQTEDYGYGVYLGQRQFRANMEFLGSYEKPEIEFLEESEYLHSACSEENFINFNVDETIDIWSEQMPIAFKQVKERNGIGREPTIVKRIYFERNGKRLKGKFKNCYKVNNLFISFY